MCRASPQHQTQKKMCTCFFSATRDMTPRRNIPVMACSTQKTDMPWSLSCILLASENVSSRVPFAQFHRQWFLERMLAHDPQVTSLHSKDLRPRPSDFGCATKREGQPQRSPAASKMVLNNLRALRFFTKMRFFWPFVHSCNFQQFE